MSWWAWMLISVGALVVWVSIAAPLHRLADTMEEQTKLWKAWGEQKDLP